MIKNVQTPPSTRLVYVDSGIQYFFFIGTGRPGYGPSVGADDQAAANELLIALGTDPIGADDA